MTTIQFALWLFIAYAVGRSHNEPRRTEAVRWYDPPTTAPPRDVKAPPKV